MKPSTPYGSTYVHSSLACIGYIRTDFRVGKRTLQILHILLQRVFQNPVKQAVAQIGNTLKTYTHFVHLLFCREMLGGISARIASWDTNLGKQGEAKLENFFHSFYRST